MREIHKKWEEDVYKRVLEDYLSRHKRVKELEKKGTTMSKTKRLRELQKKFTRHIHWDMESKDTPKEHVNIEEAIKVVVDTIFFHSLEDVFMDSTSRPNLLACLTDELRFGDLVYTMSKGDKKSFEALAMQLGKDFEGGKAPFLIPFKERAETFREAQKKLQTIFKEEGGIFSFEEGGSVEPTKKLEEAEDDTSIEDDWTFESFTGSDREAVDTLIKSSRRIPPLTRIADKISGQKDILEEQDRLLTEKTTLYKKSEREVKRLGGVLKDMVTKASVFKGVKVKKDGPIPEGTFKLIKASTIFSDELPKSVSFQVPVGNWKGEHPLVPEIDPHYIFRKDSLIKVLYAISTDQRMYLQGHTGSGKTTLIEQVCARLNYPFVRINFDSEITRGDLIGRDVLRNDKGEVSSEFVEGMLPKAMSSPCILCCDEIDFVRPDVAYVMQSALEGNSLRITEDGDRLVTPHQMFRVFATGNTVGQGDENGMYQGVRPQSLALLDRFTVWDRIDYLNSDERASLVERHYPALTQKSKEVLMNYVDEHLSAFYQKDLIQPISPRGMLAIAQATIILGDIKLALQMTVIDKANNEDRQTLIGIVDRVCQ